MNLRIIILLSLTLIFTKINSYANHSAGMDLTYECLGGNQYEFTMKLVSFCKDNIALPANYNLQIESATCGEIRQIQLAKQAPASGIDITPFCVGTITDCTDESSSVNGYKINYFKGIVTLDVPCRDWKAVVCDYSRNADITSLNVPSQSSLCVEAMVNNLDVSCNSSPIFFNNPNAFLCVGNNTCYNNGVYDPDGDYLVFELVAPQRCSTSGGCWSDDYTSPSELIDVDYITSPSHSFTDPFQYAPPINVDPVSGNFCILPTGIEKTVLALKVKEYRNGVLIGEVVRDIQIIVIDCQNNVPQLGGIDSSLTSTRYDTTVTAGTALDLYILSTDPDSQMLNMSAINLPLTSTFTVSNPGFFPEGHFQWTPTIADTGSIYCFTVDVDDQDNECTYYASATRSYCIKVEGCPNENLSINDPGTLCGSSSTITLTTSPNIGNNVWSGNGIVNTTTGEFDPVVAGIGTHTITVNNTVGSCTKTATIDITVGNGLSAEAGNDTLVCAGSLVSLGSSPTGIGGVAPLSYQWDNTGLLNDAAISNPTANLTSSTVFYVTVTDSDNCTATDSISINFIADIPIADAGNDDTVCIGSSIELGGTPAATGGSGSYTYVWSNSTLLDDDSIANPNANISSSQTFILTVTDANTGCTGVDDIFIQYVNIVPQFNQWPDSLCTGGSIILGGSPTVTGGTSPYNFSWSPNSIISDTSASNPSATITSSEWIYLTVTDANKCLITDSTFLSLDPFNINADAGGDENDSLCISGQAFIGGNPTATGGRPPYTYNWSPETYLNDSSIANPICSPTSNQSYLLVVVDSAGCVDTDSLHIRYNPLGPVADAGPDSICIIDLQELGGNETAEGGIPPYTYLWQPSYELDDSTVANPITETQVDTLYYVTVMDAEQCTDIDYIYVNAIEMNVEFTLTLEDDVVPTTVPFENLSENASVYEWDFGDTTFSDEINPTHEFLTGGDIIITLVGYYDESKLCMDTFKYGITLYPPSEILVPNVITPNGDGLNDNFEVKSTGLSSLRCEIHNRWGQFLYEFEGISNKWDGVTVSGKPAPPGTYYYIINASGYDQKEFIYNGYFILMR